VVRKVNCKEMKNNSKQKLLCVQPHSDDILLSAAHLLFSDKYEVSILTVENNPKRVKEDEKLYEFLSVPYHHLTVDFDDQSYYGYHKQYKEVTVDDSLVYLNQFFGNGVLDEIEVELMDYVQAFQKKNKNSIVVAPWGVGHPFHIFVRNVLEKYISLLWYYREFPHSYKKRSGVQVEKQKEQYDLLTSTPVEEFADVKWELAKKFYKSQSGLLFYEQGYIKKNLPEEMYVDKDEELPF